jgi:hypothetical protein
VLALRVNNCRTTLDLIRAAGVSASVLHGPVNESGVTCSNVGLCEINQGEELAVDGIRSIRAFESRYVKDFLRYFARRTPYIEILSNGKIRLTDEGRKHCQEYT